MKRSKQQSVLDMFKRKACFFALLLHNATYWQCSEKFLLIFNTALTCICKTCSLYFSKQVFLIFCIIVMLYFCLSSLWILCIVFSWNMHKMIQLNKTKTKNFLRRVMPLLRPLPNGEGAHPPFSTLTWLVSGASRLHAPFPVSFFLFSDLYDSPPPSEIAKSATDVIVHLPWYFVRPFLKIIGRN